MTDFLSPAETQTVQPGQVVVNVGNDVWKTWPNASTVSGATIGMVRIGGNPGGPITVQTTDRFPFTAFNLGPGAATTVIAGFNPSRNTIGQVIGTCDASGEIFLLSSSIGGSSSAAAIPSVANISLLRALIPNATNTVMLLGYAAVNDGGGGLFEWNTAPLPDDGGAILNAGGLGTSSAGWRRKEAFYEPLSWNIKWFGAKGDNATNDSAAINAAAAGLHADILRIGVPNYSAAGLTYNRPYLFFPRGNYVIGTTVEIPDADVIGDNAFLLDPTNSVNLMRISTIEQKVAGLSFAGGKAGLVLQGLSVNYGNWTVNSLTGDVLIERCRFFGQLGYSIWQDTISGGGAAGGGQTIVVSECDAESAAFVFTNIPTKVRECNIIWAQNPAFGNWPIPINDDAGNPMPLFCTSGTIELENDYIVPQTLETIGTTWAATHTYPANSFVQPSPTNGKYYRTQNGGISGGSQPSFPTTIGATVTDGTITWVCWGTTAGLANVCFMQGSGNMIARNTRFGGESLATIVRVKSNFSYLGRLISADAQTPAIGGIISIKDCAMSSTNRGSLFYTNGHNWLEIYDIFPQSIDLIHHQNDYSTGAIPPFGPRNIPFGPIAGAGIWIDSVSCPKSTYVGADRNFFYINLDVAGFNAAKFRTGSNPQNAYASEDVTGQLVPYMTPQSLPRIGERESVGQAKNLWPTNRQNWQNFEYQNSANVTVGSAETATGFQLKPLIATADGGTFNFSCDHVMDGLPAGTYVFSFGMSATIGGPVQIALVTSGVGTLVAVLANLTYTIDTEFQRIEVPFWHDGGNYGININGAMANGGQVLPGFFKVEPGRKASDWTTGQAPSFDGYVAREYFVNGAAPSTGGPYNRGDIAWNTNFGLTNVDYWRCVGSGSPGSWAVGNTLPFDPSQIASYIFDYDAALLTAGAITKWPDKAGSLGPGSLDMTGTATVHAAGGTGPNGAAYVQANGTSDLFRADASSITIAQEWYVVAKWNDAGTGTTGDLFGGSPINQFDCYRNSSTTSFLVNGNAGTVTTGDQGAWCAWHFYITNPGVSGTLTMIVNGHTILSAVADTVGGIANGVTAFARSSPPAGAPAAKDMFAALSIARAIGFQSALTSAQRTSMATYLNTLYGVT